jgi:hypothetical protein
MSTDSTINKAFAETKSCLFKTLVGTGENRLNRTAASLSPAADQRFVAYIGLDWEDQQYAWALQMADGHRIELG